MTEKYIDLLHRIREEVNYDDDAILTIAAVLNWLDRNPDQAPGRTITASEFDEAVESCVTEDATVPPHTFAARLGVVCVPDPEPTNAEKLNKLICQATGSTNAPLLAGYLDEAGVRAPGGDDD